MNVESILSTKGSKVYTVRDDARISDAVHILNDANIGAVVVVDANNAVVGILSERDVIRNLRGDSSASLLLSPVQSCMTPDPVTCGPSATMDEVLQIMTMRRIRHMPIVSDNGLVGLVSIGDVVKRKIELTEEEAAALRDYIAS